MAVGLKRGRRGAAEKDGGGVPRKDGGGVPLKKTAAGSGRAPFRRRCCSPNRSQADSSAALLYAFVCALHALVYTLVQALF